MFQDNQEFNINGIVFKLTGESFNVSRGTIYAAKLACKCNRDNLNQLIGHTLNGKKILGIESFAIYNQSYKDIGILLGE